MPSTETTCRFVTAIPGTQAYYNQLQAKAAYGRRYGDKPQSETVYRMNPQSGKWSQAK